jgi:kumamolisin
LSPSSEVVWNDGSTGGATGGGVSTVFQIPAAQLKIGVPGGKMRGVPDVGGCADPQTGWNIVVDGSGQNTVVGGTSAVAPMWAAIAAYLMQSLGKDVVGLQSLLYGIANAGFRDITSGNNGTYSAKNGYDCCTGLGAPVVGKLLAALQSTAPVPVPTPVPTPTTVTRTIVVSGTGVAVTVDGKTV